VPAEWLGTGALQKVVLVVTSSVSKEVLERWTFDIQTDKAAVAGDGCALLRRHPARLRRWSLVRGAGC
jgi:hypothetical protein